MRSIGYNEAALERVQVRLGERAQLVKWIVADAANVEPTESYDLWHDRAAFHFLTEQEDIVHYVEALSGHVRPGGAVIMGTFSENGPDKCSGLTIRKYSEESLSLVLSHYLNKIRCITVDHHTPFNTTQSFLFCGFRKPM
ncbi:MAG: hypothetical protein GC205_00480 [Bacteroidetes bacterium]|nr:hypothetical protein [Bacteroidota bacterium]